MAPWRPMGATVYAPSGWPPTRSREGASPFGQREYCFHRADFADSGFTVSCIWFPACHSHHADACCLCCQSRWRLFFARLLSVVCLSLLTSGLLCFVIWLPLKILVVFVVLWQSIRCLCCPWPCPKR